MKKSIVVTVVLGLMLSAGIVLAADDLPNPGITPDSPFYFLDEAGEAIGDFFTFSHEAKSEKKLKHAEERLAESKKMAEEGNTKAAEKANKKYEEDVNEATEEAKLTGKENAVQRIEEATLRHQETMQKVLLQVPEQAKDSIQKVIDKSSKGHDNAINAIRGLKEKNNSSKNE